MTRAISASSSTWTGSPWLRARRHTRATHSNSTASARASSSVEPSGDEAVAGEQASVGPADRRDHVARQLRRAVRGVLGARHGRCAGPAHGIVHRRQRPAQASHRGDLGRVGMHDGRRVRAGGQQRHVETPLTRGHPLSRRRRAVDVEAHHVVRAQSTRRHPRGRDEHAVVDAHADVAGRAVVQPVRLQFAGAGDQRRPRLSLTHVEHPDHPGRRCPVLSRWRSRAAPASRRRPSCGPRCLRARGPHRPVT